MSITLRHIEQFRSVLQNYIPNEKTLQLLHSRPLVILLGVSGAGRNTVINHLVGEGKYQFIVSDTTRPPKVRDGRLEQHGVHYNFKSEESFLADLRAGKYLEAEVIHNQQVSGISVRELQRALESGMIPINEVDIGGVRAIKALKPDVTLFFMIPPSYKEWLYRLRGREVMSSEEEANRLKTAAHILEQALASDDFTFIVNTSSHKTAERIDRYVHGTPIGGVDLDARAIATAILAELTSGTH
ncbi:MAG TPA: hypothetical protein VF597_01635 [Candidatus Saccharimonadales bacterium]|jgi:guanylate kinase